MIGEKQRNEPIFYYVRMEDMVPKDHLLRLVDKHIDLKFIREKVKHLYSHTGRPSIDPEVLLRMLLIGYLYGISSERRLCEEVKMHIGYRWFVGLSLEEKIPDHSTFSKNRHERFSENDIFQKIFDEIVRQCIAKGLLTGKHSCLSGGFCFVRILFEDGNQRSFINDLDNESCCYYSGIRVLY